MRPAVSCCRSRPSTCGYPLPVNGNWDTSYKILALLALPHNSSKLRSSSFSTAAFVVMGDQSYCPALRLLNALLIQFRADRANSRMYSRLRTKKPGTLLYSYKLHPLFGAGATHGMLFNLVLAKLMISTLGGFRAERHQKPLLATNSGLRMLPHPRLSERLCYRRSRQGSFSLPIVPDPHRLLWPPHLRWS